MEPWWWKFIERLLTRINPTMHLQKPRSFVDMISMSQFPCPGYPHTKADAPLRYPECEYCPGVKKMFSTYQPLILALGILGHCHSHPPLQNWCRQHQLCSDPVHSDLETSSSWPLTLAEPAHTWHIHWAAHSPHCLERTSPLWCCSGQ